MWWHACPGALHRPPAPERHVRLPQSENGTEVSAIEVHYQMVQADGIAEHSIRYSMRMKSARRRWRRVKRLRQALETVRRIKLRPGERPKVQGARGRS
jgi:hypothetical protein